MKFSILLLCFVFLFVKPLLAQECQNVAKSVLIRGFSLGMTEGIVKKRYPKIEFFKDLDVVGLSSWTMPGSGSSDDIFTEAEREGLESLNLTFFDKKLSQINIVYNGFTEWDSLSEFTNASSKSLNLPPSVNWKRTDDKNAIRIDCKDFFVIARLEMPRSRYELQEPSLFFSLTAFESNLKNRKNTQKEEQKKIFKP